MSLDIKPRPSLTPTTLLDEVMSALRRGDAAHYTDLARATWSPATTLASLTGTLSSEAYICNTRDPA